MTKKEFAQAKSLVEALLKHTRKGSPAHLMAKELQNVLQPPPTMADIMLAVDGETHKDRAATIGISRQGYYNLMQGLARPNSITRKRLAELTGFAEEEIQQAAP